MEAGPRGSESDDVDDRSPSPASQEDDNEGLLQSSMSSSQIVIKNNGGNVKMTRCMVCKELTDNHHIHYGALCCFSCRAFFRRANQRTKKSSYVCKQDSKCDVSYKNRKKCQKCRYEACLAAGMDPNLVLTEEQKKARFRKKSEKRGDNSGRQMADHDRGVRSRDPNVTMRGPPTAQKKRRRTSDNLMPRDDMRSPDFYEEISNNNVGGAVYDDFEQMIMRAGTYGGMLQSDTLHDLEGTFALAQEMKGMSRPEHHTSFLNFANMATDRQRACDPTMMMRPAFQITNKLSTSAPVYSQWSPASPYQHQLTLITKQEPYTLTSYTSSQYGMTASQSQPLMQQQSALQYQVQDQSLHPLRVVEDPQSSLEQFLPSAEDLLDDPSLRPLGIEPMPPVDQHIIAPFCSTPLFGSSILGSPISTSLLNTPVPTPGKLTTMTAMETTTQATEEPAVVVVKQQPAPTADPNESYIKKLLEDFDAMQLDTDLIYRLASFHSGHTHLSEYDIGRVFFHIGESFRQFAVKQPTFQELSVTDQCHLLTTNQPLFIHYILGRYFTAAEGVDQLQWLIGPVENFNSDQTLVQMLPNVVHVSMKMFNRDAAIFNGSAVMRAYAEKASAGLAKLGLTQKDNGLMAAIILFSASPAGASDTELLDGVTELSSIQVVGDQFSFLSTVVRESSYSQLLPENVADVVDVLAELKKIFLNQPSGSNTESIQYKWATSSAGETNRMARELGMPYTREEEDWLTVQLSKYSSAYREVPMGEDFVKEFIMFSYDVPLSKHFVYRGYATFAERFRRVLKTQPGFNDLNDKDQAMVWKQGCAKSVACCFAKSEHCTTGNDQLQFMFGELDRNNWKQNYATQIAVAKVNKIRKILMVDCNRVSATYDTQELMEYLRLVGTLGEVTSYEELFPILTLIALLSGDGLSSEGARFATDMRNKYFTVLGRKLVNDRRAYSNICLGLNEIEELSHLMKKLET